MFNFTIINLIMKTMPKTNVLANTKALVYIKCRGRASLNAS